MGVCILAKRVVLELSSSTNFVYSLVAANFAAICPGFPIPVIITFPLQLIMIFKISQYLSFNASLVFSKARISMSKIFLASFSTSIFITFSDHFEICCSELHLFSQRFFISPLTNSSCSTVSTPIV